MSEYVQECHSITGCSHDFEAVMPYHRQLFRLTARVVPKQLSARVALSPIPTSTSAQQETGHLRKLMLSTHIL
jgi:hypothetical protein